MLPQRNQPISVKELRQNFPKFIDQLDGGTTFVLIHRSHPIARIVPYADMSKKASSIALIKKERS